jgi:hypothetical protein
VLRHGRGHFEHAQQGFGVADNVLESVAPFEGRSQVPHLLDKILPLHGAVHCQQKRIVVDGFGDVVVGSEAHGLDRSFDRAECSYHNHCGLDIFLSDRSKQVDAAQVGHAEIGNQQLGRPL